MKGKVLGFTASSGTGTITGEDGRRYGFAASEWRSDKPAAAGLAVDFELRGEEAVGIYPVTAAAIDVVALSSSPAVLKARSLAMGTLAFPLAILLLIACIMPAINSLARGGQGLSLLSLGPVVTELSGRADAEREMAESRAKDFEEREARLQSVIASTGPGTPIGWFGSGGTAGEALKELQDERAKAAPEESHPGAFLLNFMWLVYAVPLLALALIGLSWTGRALRTASLAAGLSGVVAFALLWNLTSLATIGDGISMLTLGFGAWIMLLTSIALLLSGFGKIRNPLATA
jgi:hypothetical protein